MDRILVTESIADEGLAALKAVAQVDVRTDLDKAALLAVLPEYDALVVRSGTKVTAEVLEAGTRLRVVGRAGTGVDNIDVDAATRRGIIVVNAPASNSVAVAELTVGMILALARTLNMNVVAFGPTADVYTPELLQRTYGGRLTILSEVAQALGAQEPPR